MQGLLVTACGIFSCGMQTLSCSMQTKDIPMREFQLSMQTLSCGMWDLVPWLEIEPQAPSIGSVVS